jgi:hypothetical protein
MHDLQAPLPMREVEVVDFDAILDRSALQMLEKPWGIGEVAFSKE